MEFLNDQILLNALPAHIAFNFAVRSDPYAHLCPSVGVLCARFGHSGDWVGEFGFDRLNRIACEIDQRIGQLSEKRVEKVRTGHCYYTMACGILPEMAKNVNDAPCTIGEQLATLADLSEFIQELAESDGLDLAIGIDCGAALSLVVGNDRPHYELLGQPVTRARKLAESASALGNGCVLVSEDVFLALRPRRSQFHFDERSALSVGPGLVAYSLLPTSPPAAAATIPADSASHPPPPPSNLPPPPVPSSSSTGHPAVAVNSAKHLADPLPPLPPPHRNMHNNNNNNGIGGAFPCRIRPNPIVDGRAISAISSSAQSLCSSELFSIDLSVETDSLELEWVTPEMVANGQYRPFPESPPAQNYKAERAGFYSELSVADSSQSHLNGNEERGKKRPLRKNKLPSTGKSTRKSSGRVTSAFGSELSLPGQPQFGFWNLANKKVDRMLKEMAAVQGPDAAPECPFPKEWTMENAAKGGIGANGKKEPSGCPSEYENGSRRSLAAAAAAYCSDSDAAAFGSTGGRLDRLRIALRLGGGLRGGGKDMMASREDGNEADRSCSISVASSQILPLKRLKAHQLLGARWRRSAHSIGYEDEYELASAPLSSYSSSSIGISTSMMMGGWAEKQQQPGPMDSSRSFGENSLFVPIDAEEEECQIGNREGNKGEEGAMEGMPNYCDEEGEEEEEDAASLRKQMLQLSRDIRRNFGDFQLASFPDVDEQNNRAATSGNSRRNN